MPTTTIPPACGQMHLFDLCNGWRCPATVADADGLAVVSGHWTHGATCEYCASVVCPEHCECRNCAGCGQDPDDDSWTKCERCDTCPDCCECEHCENTYHGRQWRNGAYVTVGTRAVESVCTRCDRCTECCECSHCVRCGPVESSCEHCDRCDSGYGQCCQCVRCEHCRDAVDSRCDGCRQCDDCGCTDDCDAGSDDDDIDGGSPEPVRFRSNSAPHFHTSGKSKLVQNRSRRYAALEIEVSSAEAGSEINAVAEDWDAQIVQDGSLPSGGFEINTAPANGDLLLDQISDWADALSAQSAEANRQCGLHVHIDARDFTHYDMRRLVLLYEQLEVALFGMVPASRRTAEWCQPCGPAYARAIRKSAMPRASKANLIDGIYSSGTTPKLLRSAVASAKASKYASERYHALNIHSWFYRGTVECRLHTGTTNREKLANWALLWVAIVDHAYKTTEKAITADTRDSLAILKAIAPSAEIAEWIQTRTDAFAGGYR